MPQVLYLHGFRSSPQSFKALMLVSKLRGGKSVGDLHFSAPQLLASPRLSIDLILDQYRLEPEDTVIGSSLGGFYATYLAEKFGCRCVLLNPAIHAARDLAGFIGEHKMYHSDEPFVFKAEYIQELKALEMLKITRPERYFLIAAKGDELLDWRDMLGKYRGVATKLLEGSDHGLSDFADHIDEVLEFASGGSWVEARWKMN